ncbi:MAG: DUF3604 domain-containing protein, partial [Acidobacteria bacterium]|nr:DUF3604 domain-containing protein [Acidobacteriota bacterium]
MLLEKRGFGAGAAAAVAGLTAVLCLTSAPVQPRRDYLSPKLRAAVNKLKAEAAAQPTTGRNLLERGSTLWEWINAYSLTGGPVPVNATQIFSSVFEMGDALARAEALPSGAGRLAGNIDELIHEFRIKDEQPDALPKLKLSANGPFPAESWQTIVETVTVGGMPMNPGSAIMLGHMLMSDDGAWQYDDPAADNYVSIRASNPAVRFGKFRQAWSGMHGGFRGASNNLAFRLAAGTLRPGDTVAITFGDRSGGSRGYRMQSFGNDQVLLPLYFDLEAKGLYLTPLWPAFQVQGKAASAVRVTAPSIVRPGEKFEIYIHNEDDRCNRAAGPMPAYEVTANGRPIRQVAAGADAVVTLKDIQLDSPGTYRFQIRSADGKIAGLSNPVWVQEKPLYRIYWGETHAHSGMSEGIGSIDGFYRYGRDDATLDFLGLSEHDNWLDDSEWLRMQKAVERYTQPGRFIAFLGYEWTVTRANGGHHNVFFRSPNHRRVPMQKAYTLSLLYQGLRANNETSDVLIIPHAHQAGDWRRNDPDMERLVEIMSMHGTFEWFGNYYLKRGFDAGFTAASDDHRTRPGYSGTMGTAPLASFGGLVAAMAPEKTANAIFDALRNRITYAVTSAQRILLDVRLNGQPMGRRIAYSPERRLQCRMSGPAPIDRVDVVKNGDVVFSRRFATAPLRPQARVQVGFDSASEPFIRDNPRGYRRWKGTLEVKGARLAGLEQDFDNPRIEFARRDPRNLSRVVFYTETRGRADLMTLELEGASPSTEFRFDLEETVEAGASPPVVRPMAKIPA